MEEELPSAFDVAKADDIELQEIMKNTTKSMENLIVQLEDPLFEHPLHELKAWKKANEH